MLNSFGSQIQKFLDLYGLNEKDTLIIPERVVDYGDCIPGCPVCGGIGWLPNSSTDDGFRICPNYYKAHWPRDLGIDQEEAHLLKLGSLQETELMKKCADYARKLFKNRSGMLYIYGSVGTGKTVFMKAFLLWAFFKYGIIPGHYTTHAIMMDRLRSSFGEKTKGDQYDHIIKYYSELPILAIDEVGRDKDSEFSLASFGKIIDRRYTLAKAGKAITIMASNFKPEDILDAYLVDRLRDISNDVVSVQSPSLRRQQMVLKVQPDWWKGQL